MIRGAEYHHTTSPLRCSDSGGVTDRRTFVLAACATLVSVVLVRESDAQEKADNRTLKEKIKDVLETLTERERQVLEQRFGLVDGYSRTLEEVGRQFRVNRDRIRQIEAKALRKMRHPTRIRQLEGFLEAAET